MTNQTFLETRQYFLKIHIIFIKICQEFNFIIPVRSLHNFSRASQTNLDMQNVEENSLNGKIRHFSP